MPSHLLLIAWLIAAAQSDSVAMVRWAQRAQSAFEWRRGLLVPRSLGHGGGSCDERIGRFCIMYDDGPDSSPPEPQAIRAARDRLLALLDSAAVLLPGDEWIAGQRVRYLVESNRPTDALAAARGCRATLWWCDALAGFALHAAGDDAAADSVYAEALAGMPATERCRWTDLTPLLDGALRERFSRMGCVEREALASHLWWLAQPLYSRDGNDRRAEHFARLTMTRMLVRAGSAWSGSTGDDLREMVIRYGWPIGWSGDETLGADGRTVLGHLRLPAFHFLPDRAPSAVGPGWDWTLTPPRSREQYAPIYAKAFESLAPDVSVFRRGESTLVVVAYDLTRDTLWGGEPLTAAAVLARDEGTAPVVVREQAASPRGVLVTAAPWEAQLAGLEVTRDDTRRAGRARVVVPVRDPSRVQLSDPLVFDPVDSLPQQLDSILPLVHGPARVPHGARVGMYWETYGLATTEPIETSVTVARLGTGWLRRVGARLGLGSRSRETALAWRETAQPVDGVAAHAIIVDVASLDPGRYRIAVSVAARGRTATASRELEIVGP